MITGILAKDVPIIWPHVESRIRNACEMSRGKFNESHILEQLLSQEVQLWIAKEGDSEAIVITQIVNYPTKRVCWIRICTGDGREDWAHHLNLIEAWAKAQGCTGMELTARKGWRKILKDYDHTHDVLEKEL